MVIHVIFHSDHLTFQYLESLLFRLFIPLVALHIIMLILTQYSLYELK